jgi:hypothetical protein
MDILSMNAQWISGIWLIFLKYFYRILQVNFFKIIITDG